MNKEEPKKAASDAGEEGKGSSDKEKAVSGQDSAGTTALPKAAPSTEEVPIRPDQSEVEFVHASLKSLQPFAFLTAVRRLNVRRNLLTSTDGIGALVTLEELELYDNQIAEISGLERLVNLRVLDLSYNRIRKLQGLQTLTRLRKLYLVHNKIPAIEGLDSLGELELLELGDNKIRAMGGLDGLASLRRIFLGKNKIRKIEGLQGCPRLIELALQANRITVIENVPASVSELYLSENGLSELGPLLPTLTNLHILDLSINFIRSIRGVSKLRQLTDFWFNDNALADWAEVAEELGALPALSTVYLHGNPVARTADGSAANPDYRRKVLLALPRLTRLDAIPVARPSPPA